MRAYSMDLRDRVLRDSDAGLPVAAVAVQYHVSASWVRRLKQRRRETGEVAPRQQRYGRHPVLAPQLHTLAALIQEQPDRTLADLQVALGTSASLATIWRAVKQLGFTLKKNGTRVRTRSVPTSRPPAPTGWPPPRPSTRPASSFSMKRGSPPISSGDMGVAPAASGSPITRPTAALRVLDVCPSNGATCRCPLPFTGSRGLDSPASAVVWGTPIPRRPFPALRCLRAAVPSEHLRFAPSDARCYVHGLGQLVSRCPRPGGL